MKKQHIKKFNRKKEKKKEKMKLKNKPERIKAR